MRIWDLPVNCLCRNHLLAEHRELHAIWSIIVNEKRGYSRHPEVLRWHGCLGALWNRHEEQVEEMTVRGYAHRSTLEMSDVPRRHRAKTRPAHLESVDSQKRRIELKGCGCFVRHHPHSARNSRFEVATRSKPTRPKKAPKRKPIARMPKMPPAMEP